MGVMSTTRDYLNVVHGYVVINGFYGLKRDFRKTVRCIPSHSVNYKPVTLVKRIVVYLIQGS